MNQIFLETRIFRLSDGEKIMTLAFFVLIQYRSVTDGQTDGHLCSGYTSACIACYANALVIMDIRTIILYCELKFIRDAEKNLLNSQINGSLSLQLLTSQRHDGDFTVTHLYCLTAA